MSKELDFVLNDSCVTECVFCFKKSRDYSKKEITSSEIISKITNETKQIHLTCVTITEDVKTVISEILEHTAETEIILFIDTIPLANKLSYISEVTNKYKNVVFRMMYNSSMSMHKLDVIKFFKFITDKQINNISFFFVLFKETQEEILKIKKLIENNYLENKYCYFKFYDCDESYIQEIKKIENSKIFISSKDKFESNFKSCKNI